MPHFYIDTDDGDDCVRDPVGFVLDSDAVAREYALDVLPDMARDRIPDARDQRVLSVGVRDKSGVTIYRASLTLVGEWLTRTAS